MQPDPREPTGDLGYDMAHEVAGSGPPRPDETPTPVEADGGDDTTGDHGYDEAHDFRR